MVFQVGIVGCGVIGHRLALAFSKVDEISIKAVCDIAAEKAKDLGEQYQAAIYNDARRMVATEDLDILYIGIPPKFHHEMVKLAVNNELHVICEKPLAVSLGHGQDMVELVDKQGLVSAINLPFRYTPGFREMVSRYQNNDLGEVRRVDLTFRFPQWPRSWQDVEWLKSKEQGGPLREVGTHFLFGLREVFGSIPKVLCKVSHPVDGEYERTAQGVMETPSGIPVLLDLLTDTAHPEENTITIHGEKKSLSLVGWYRLIENYNTPSEVVINEERMDTSVRLVDQFVASLQGKSSDLVSFHDAYHTQRLLDAIYTSGNRWIEL